MFKYTLALGLLLLGTSSLFSWATAPSTTIIGSNTITSKEYEFKNKECCHIKVTCSGHIDIKIGTVNKVTVTTSENVIAFLKVSLEKETLTIEPHSDVSWKATQPIEISIELTLDTLKSLRSITRTGSVSISVVGKTIHFGPHFSLNTTGSGSINLAEALSNTKTISLSSTGSGEISASTINADSVVITINGSSALTLQNGSAKTVSLESTGSGTIDIQTVEVTDSIELSLTGSSTLKCRTQGSVKGTLTGTSSVKNYAHAKINTISTAGKRAHYKEMI